MSLRGAEILRLRLRCDSSAPRRARAELAKLDEIGPVREDALLVASELATNAVLHSGSGPDDEFELLAEEMPDGVRIAVTDPGHSRSTPRPADLPPPSAGGWGLRVVDAIARKWGTERMNGVRVWVELAF